MSHDFFVGYAPASKKTLMFVAAVVAGLAALVVGVSALGQFQRTPGAALERPAFGHQISGVLHYGPYASLVILDEGGRERQVLLAGSGKYGPSRRLRPLENQAVSLKGNLFRRDGRMLLEVGAGPEPTTFEPVLLERLAQRETVELGSVRLEGRIVDSKCYFGRMRPGEGRAHRACAQYCIEGGMAPILVTHDEDGVATHYLVATEDGSRANAAVLEYVAEPVRVTGDLFAHRDQLVVHYTGIERL